MAKQQRDHRDHGPSLMAPKKYAQSFGAIYCLTCLVYSTGFAGLAGFAGFAGLAGFAH